MIAVGGTTNWWAVTAMACVPVIAICVASVAIVYRISRTPDTPSLEPPSWVPHNRPGEWSSWDTKTTTETTTEPAAPDDPNITQEFAVPPTTMQRRIGTGGIK